MLPLIAAAMLGGVVRAGVGAIQGNQKKQRNKGYINANYGLAKERLDRSQATGRQDVAESLNARGLAQGGTVSASPIHAAMVNGKMTADGPAASTVGGQEVRDANAEMSLEQTDLTQQRDQALGQNKAGYNDDLLGAGVSGFGAAADIYGAGKDLGSMAADRSKIHSMMLSGAAYDGVHPNDPLGDPTSAWSTHPRPANQLADPAQSNASFNV